MADNGQSQRGRVRWTPFLDALEADKRERESKRKMAVRAKFYVTQVTQSKNNYGGVDGEILTTIKLACVSGGSDENRQFFRWSPAGSIDLGTVNPAVVEQMHIGDEFYVDFTPARPETGKPADE